MSHAMWSQPRLTGHGGEVWQNVVHWRREWQAKLQYSCLENPMNSVKRPKDRTLKDELPRSVGANTLLEISGETTPERMKRWSQSKKKHIVVDVTCDGSKVQCCKQQYCIGTWKVRSMNQGKLEVIKQEMARVNIDVLGISELKWTRMLLLSHFSRVRLCVTP